MENFKRIILFSLLAVLCLMLAACTEETKESVKNDEIREEISSEQVKEETVTETTTELQKISLDGLSDDDNAWYCMKNDDHKTPEMPNNIDLKKYNASATGDTEKKEIYLTFDEGYENGYTENILDILKEKNVPAAFFVLEHYVESQPELVERMVNEGHLVCNHSAMHILPTQASDEEIEEDIIELEKYFKEKTGKDMAKFYRPPSGEYTERCLAIAHNLGYKTVFWSLAYADWLADEPLGKEVTYSTVMDNYHNGCIILMHSVNASNGEALSDIIDSLRAEGYEFKSLDELPE
ncbi:MAG: polysaccharide deacetylase family protein [Firmicutes bacterium]|nr:polysaccharide deacetylase family protein [Bacillota bacterium]